MDLLIAGLFLFLATHLLPSVPSLRNSLQAKLGALPYKLLFSVLTIVGLVLIVKGLRVAPFEALYTPPTWGRHPAMLLMLFAVYFFLSNTALPAPSSAKTWTAHPVNWAVILWASAHLLANGDVAHVVLFGSLAAFAIISIVSGNKRGQQPQEQRPPLIAEALTLAFTLIVYGGLVWGHAYFTGMPLIPSA